MRPQASETRASWSFPADGQALEVVQEREGLLDDVAELAEALDVRGAFAGDHRQDAPPA